VTKRLLTFLTIWLVERKKVLSLSLSLCLGKKFSFEVLLVVILFNDVLVTVILSSEFLLTVIILNDVLVLSFCQVMFC
jgi:hypothetical protein